MECRSPDRLAQLLELFRSNMLSGQPDIRVSHFPLAPALFLLPMSLDFRSAEVGGTVWQYVVTGLVAVGWILFFGNGKFLRPRGALWKACHWAIVLTILGSFVSVAVNGTPLGDYARVFISIALFGMAFFFGVRMAHTGRTTVMGQLIDFGCLTSIVFTLFAGLTVAGQSISEIRYQILSPVLLPFEAILLHKILVARIKRRRNTLLLAGCLALQLLSVTRSVLLAFAVLLAVALWISSPTIAAFIRRSFRMAIPGLVIAAIVVGASSVISPEVISRWEQRIFTVETLGADPTTLSRLAEAKEQLDRWSSGPVSILVGQGFGASYGWSKDFYDEMLATGAYDLESLDQSRSYFGHNYWISSLFSGGLLFGLAIPVMLICATAVCLRTARTMLRCRTDESARLEISRAALVVASLLVTTIGGNPFGTRYTPIVVGASLGVLVVMRRQALQRWAASLEGAQRSPRRGVVAGRAA